MPIKNLTLNQTALGPTPWVGIDPAKKRTIQVVIVGAATVDIEASNNNRDSVAMLGATNITASCGFADDAAWQQMRVNVKSITNGASVSVIVGEP